MPSLIPQSTTAIYHPPPPLPLFTLLLGGGGGGRSLCLCCPHFSLNPPPPSRPLFSPSSTSLLPSPLPSPLVFPFPPLLRVPSIPPGPPPLPLSSPQPYLPSSQPNLPSPLPPIPPPRAMERRTRLLNARCLLPSVNLAQTDEGRGAVGRRRCMRSERRRLVSGQGCWSRERHGNEIGSWVRGRDSREGERGKIRNKKGEKIFKRGERKGNTELVEDSSV